MPTNSIYDFLNDRRIQLPLDWSDWNGCYLSYIEDLFNHYKRLIAEFNREDELLCEIDRSNGTISELCNGIIDTIQLYIYKGKEDAYEKFKNLLNQQNINTCLNKLYSREIVINGVRDNPFENLYKVRNFSGKNDAFFKLIGETSLEMFHAPRGTKGRYNYGEFPCLYLGGCIPFCLRETINFSEVNEEILWQGCQSIKVGWVKYKVRDGQNLMVLDFGWTPKNLKALARGYLLEHSQNHDLADLIIYQMIMWPLIAACSVRVRTQKGDKPEYIIPQQLIRYVYENNDEIDGIRYFSTKYVKYSERKCDQYRAIDFLEGQIRDFDPENDLLGGYSRTHINFVFPAWLNSNEQYSSRLAEKFEISQTNFITLHDLEKWGIMRDCSRNSVIPDNAINLRYKFNSISDLLEDSI